MNLLTDRELGQMVRLSVKRFKPREVVTYIEGYRDGYLASDNDYMDDNLHEVRKLFDLIDTLKDHSVD